MVTTMKPQDHHPAIYRERFEPGLLNRQLKLYFSEFSVCAIIDFSASPRFARITNASDLYVQNNVGSTCKRKEVAGREYPLRQRFRRYLPSRTLEKGAVGTGSTAWKDGASPEKRCFDLSRWRL